MYTAWLLNLLAKIFSIKTIESYFRKFVSHFSLPKNIVIDNNYKNIIFLLNTVMTRIDKLTLLEKRVICSFLDNTRNETLHFWQHLIAEKKVSPLKCTLFPSNEKRTKACLIERNKKKEFSIVKIHICIGWQIYE